MTHRHAPPGLIADFAAGTLSDGMRLLVASHLAFCGCCRDRLARLELLCGTLLALGPAEPLSRGCRERALARLDAVREDPPADTALAASGPFPVPLSLRLPPACDLRWQPVRPGLSECRLDGFPTEAVGLMRAAPGTTLRCPDFSGHEARLVLTGRLRSGAYVYDRGDLALPDPATRPEPSVAPEAFGREECLCLVVRPGPTPVPTRPHVG